MTRWSALVPLLILMLAGGCGRGEEPAPKGTAPREPALREVRPPELRAQPLGREDYLRQAEAQLQEIQRLVADMQERLEKLSPELKARVSEQLRHLEPKIQTARRKLQELKFTGGEAFKRLQAELDELLKELKRKADELPGGFKFKL